MNFDTILSHENAAALFAYLALREDAGGYNHLERCLDEDDVSWRGFLELSAAERMKQYSFLSAGALDRITHHIESPGRILALIRKLTRNKVLALSKNDERYPERLKQNYGEEAPPFIFCRGSLDCFRPLSIAVVGTRRPSPRGIRSTNTYTRLLARRGVSIISGGARGVDTHAYCAALDAGGCTVAVLPSGLFTYRWSADQKKKFNDKSTLFLSPFFPDEPFKNRHAVYRNGIIAALSDGALIPETPLRSGTGYVIRDILRSRRPLFAVQYASPVPESAGGNRSLLDSGAVALPAEPGSPQKIVDTILEHIRL